MAVATRKTELSPLEAIVVETTLGALARGNTRDGVLARIQQLTKERQALYAKSAARPFLASANGPRIRAIGAEIELLWEALRRERASQRVRIERALHVTSEDEDEVADKSDQEMGGSSDAA